MHCTIQFLGLFTKRAIAAQRLRTSRAIHVLLVIVCTHAYFVYRYIGIKLGLEDNWIEEEDLNSLNKFYQFRLSASSLRNKPPAFHPTKPKSNSFWVCCLSSANFKQNSAAWTIHLCLLHWKNSSQWHASEERYNACCCTYQWWHWK